MQVLPQQSPELHEPMDGEYRATDEATESDDDEEEIRAGIRRNLRFGLIAAGLLRPNREITEQSVALEAKLRQAARNQEKRAILNLRHRKMRVEDQ